MRVSTPNLPPARVSVQNFYSATGQGLVTWVAALTHASAVEASGLNPSRRSDAQASGHGTGVIMNSGLTSTRAVAIAPVMIRWAAKLCSVSGSMAAITRLASGCSSDT